MSGHRIGLVGCVSRKRSIPARAEDLYVSTLFIGRRHYVERSCDEWFILSAKHGLVARTTILEPYDVALTGQGRAIKRKWAEAVLTALDHVVAPNDATTFEIHAGADYLDFGLVDGLRERGANVDIPTRGLRQGEQLRFYRDDRTRVR